MDSLPPPTYPRRRSQRLVMAVPVTVQGELAAKTPFSEQTQTVVVNAHGALVQLKTSVQPGQHVALLNLFTREKQECVVVSAKADDEGVIDVGLEFAAPNPDFWHISFPPEDWSYRHPDAKKKRP